MLSTLHDEALVPCTYVVADCLSGNKAEFLDAVARSIDRVSVAAIAHRIPDAWWYRRTVSQGTTGPIDSECTTRRVTLCRDSLPERTVWLVLKRSLGDQPR